MPVDSYVIQYQRAEEKFFGGAMSEVSVVLKTFDYSDRKNQDAVLKLKHELEASKYIYGGVECWLTDFLEWVPRNAPNASLVDGRPKDGAYNLIFMIAFWSQLSSLRLGDADATHFPVHRISLLPGVVHLDGK